MDADEQPTLVGVPQPAGDLVQGHPGDLRHLGVRVGKHDVLGIEETDLDPLVDGVEGVTAFYLNAGDGQILFI